MVSIILELSTGHRNTYATYSNEKACHILGRVDITNIKDEVSNRTYDKRYDLTKFDDKLKLYRQHLAYISNGASTNTLLDFSNNKECQDAREEGIFLQIKTLKESLSICERVEDIQVTKIPL